MRPSHLAPPLLLGVAIVGIAAGDTMRAIGGLSLATYAFAQIVACATVTHRGEKGEVALLPVVFTTMHLSFGAGYLLGCVRFGPPARALWRLTRRKLGKSNPSPPSSLVTSAPSPRKRETA
jgi:succinoglycan biosynthesis protein ExoA